MSRSDEIQRAARETIEETGCLTLVAAHCAHTFGWSGSLRSWRARVSQWGNPRDPHRYPAEALPIIVSCSGRDPFTPILLRAGMRKVRKIPAAVAGRCSEAA